MDQLLLARLQFAATCVYHFFFVPLTLGLSIFIALMETIYVRTGNEVYKAMTKFWGRLFLINFAMGVVTGIVMEFQFGMNWSEYSRYVGDIFGAPLAIEALLAFFLESTFLGVWIFGWERLSKKAHALTIWLVAIGANISALWILIANSFMQEPVGYVINEVAGRAEMTDFGAVLFNPNIFVQYPHVLFSGLTTAAFFILGISGYHLLRKKAEDLFKRSFKIAAILGLVAVVLVGVNGHSQTQHVVEVQPMKMAAAEGLWETEDPASFSLITIGDLESGKALDIRIPGVLSFLSYNRFSGEVKGMKDLQAVYEDEFGVGDYTPPWAVIYWAFRIMVGAGMAMVLLGLFAVFVAWKGQETRFPRLMMIYPLAIFLPYIANSTGWIMAEVGRWPWAVYDVLKIEDAVSPNVPVSALLITLIGFVLVYGILMAADIYLLNKYAKLGPTEEVQDDGQEVEPSLIVEQA
jgi:cytochrome d ubiquinol oxidase subunit I